MYLSRIELNLDSGRVRRDLADPYEMHSTLSRALADPSRPDAVPAPFLWRVEPFRAGERPVVLMQSTTTPSWSDVESRSRGWTQAARTISFDPAALARTGNHLRFRVRANPTITRQGKRHALIREEEQDAWLARQGDRLGFRIEASRIGNPSRIVTRKRGTGGAPVVVHAVTWDGVLTVTSPNEFVGGLRSGLGHGKFLGLGLLSVARLDE